MTAPRVLVHRLSCQVQQAVKSPCLQLICNISNTTLVWLSVLILSFPSSNAVIEDYLTIQHCLEHMGSLKNSSAMLYTPTNHLIAKNCALKCYTTELEMVMDEENITDDCVGAFIEKVKELNEHCVQCETHPLKNVTTFLGEFVNLLQILSN